MTKWDTRFLELATLVSTWSKDPSTKVGAVIVDDNKRVVSVGFNGFPRGVKDDFTRYEDRELKLKMVVHAEINAILFAKQPLDGCTLYTVPFQPCSRCAAQVIQSGIKRVVTFESDNPRWLDEFRTAQIMFDESGVALNSVQKQDAPKPQ
jgi:dCMP deaminase